MADEWLSELDYAVGASVRRLQDVRKNLENPHDEVMRPACAP
jgi:hypothetical protein